MCGIVGVHGVGDKVLVKDMMKSISHRGPDDSGTYFDDMIGFGHQRLSIIDLSTGHQPIFNEDESVVTIYNGEIYNYRELRKVMEGKGHRFATNTDTEVIVHLYEQYGEDFVKHLRGMYAIALWDIKNKKLVLARDRIGIKPLYYVNVGEALLFSSEIKAFLKHDGFTPELDLVSCRQYLSYQYTVGPRTCLKNVKKLQPGEMLVVDASGKRVKSYWDLNIKPMDCSDGECSEKLGKIMEDCIEMRLMSDVPLGAYLSGGFDSSAIVAIMSEKLKDPVNTFSIGFGYDDVDEIKYAKIVAEHFQTDHNEIIIGSEDVIKSLPDIIWHLDEPIGDPAATPSYFLAKKASEKVKVILTGEGGDEAFGGYRTYKLMNFAEKIRKIIPNTVKSVMPHLTKNIKGRDREKRYLSYLSSKDDEIKYPGQGHVFDVGEKDEYFTDEFKKITTQKEVESPMRKYFMKDKKMDYISRLQYVDIKTWVPDDLLMKLDKTSMAFAIEGRVPFLDHELLEYCLSMPQNMRIRNGAEKYMAKKIMTKRMPETVTKRKKRGFMVPMHHWMENELRDYAEDMLSEKTLQKRGMLNVGVSDILKKPKTIWRGHQIWAIITLELWSRMYVDRIKQGRVL